MPINLRWLSPTARNDYRHRIGMAIGFVGIGTRSQQLEATLAGRLSSASEAFTSGDSLAFFDYE